MTQLDLVREHMATLRRLAQRYRDRASRDAAWVQTWTGELDPELEEIDATMRAAVRVNLKEDELAILLEELLMGEETEELLVQRLRLDLLLAKQEHEALRAAFTTQALTWLQEERLPLSALPSSARWVAQGLFTTAQDMDDLELIVALLSAQGLLVSLPQWLQGCDLAHLPSHPFTQQASASIEWLTSLTRSSLPDYGGLFYQVEDEASQLITLAYHGYVVALTGMSAAARGASAQLVRLVHAARTHHGDAGLGLGVDHVLHTAQRGLLELSTQGGTLDHLDSGAALWLLSIAGHWELTAAMLAAYPEYAEPLIIDMLREPTPARAVSTSRLMHVLKRLPRSAQTREMFWSMTSHSEAPVRHLAWYTLAERRAEGVVEALSARIRQGDDPLEREEMLFMLAASPEEEARGALRSLRDDARTDEALSALIDEALESWEDTHSSVH